MGMLIRVGLCVAGAVLALVFMLTGPIMLDAWQHDRAFGRTFELYSSHLMSHDLAAAYEMGDTEFKAAVTNAAFQNMHQDMTSKFGQLKRITHTRTIVDGKGKPMLWIANTDATLEFAGGAVKLRYVFQESDNAWRLHGFRFLTGQ